MKNEVSERTDRTMTSYRCGDAFEWDKWRNEIPEISFPAEWKIRIIPPFGGAIIRFVVVTKTGRQISVYLDAYDQMGCMDMKPYWEIHPSENGDCERFIMDDVAGLLEGISRSIGAMGLPYPPLPTADDVRGCDEG